MRLLLRQGRPLKVFKAIVSLVVVYMVDSWLSLWIREEGKSHEPVYKETKAVSSTNP